MDKVFFFLVALPFLIVREGYEMFFKGRPSKFTGEKMLYGLLIFFVFLLLILWLNGYRF